MLQQATDDALWVQEGAIWCGRSLRFAVSEAMCRRTTSKFALRAPQEREIPAPYAPLSHEAFCASKGRFWRRLLTLCKLMPFSAAVVVWQTKDARDISLQGSYRVDNKPYYHRFAHRDCDGMHDCADHQFRRVGESGDDSTEAAIAAECAPFPRQKRFGRRRSGCRSISR